MHHNIYLEHFSLHIFHNIFQQFLYTFVIEYYYYVIFNFFNCDIE